MKASAIQELFRSVGPWVNWERTTDRLHFGDPETEVTGIAVAWKPYWSDLKRAHELGCNLFIGHESIFREGNGDERNAASGLERPKLEWLQETGMVVYRCHDVWDLIPDIGVRDSWARGLGFEGKPIAISPSKYCRVEDVSGHTFGSLCAQIAARVKSVNQEAILAVGDPEVPVTRLGLGTGAGVPLEEMLDLGADVCVCTDDYFRQVREGTLLRDLGVSFITVNHATAEEWGIRNLFEYVRDHFPSVPVHFIPQGCIYHVVG